MNIIKLLRNYFLLLKSDLFDSKYYLKENPDVAKAKVNPILHYLKFGWKEGRNPSPLFNTSDYISFRPDIVKADICPLVHYELFGKKEFLSFCFDKIKYLEKKIADLDTKYGKRTADLDVKTANLDTKYGKKTADLDTKYGKRTADLDVKTANLDTKYGKKTADLDTKYGKKTADLDTKYGKKTVDLERFKRDILFTYENGINKEKVSCEIEKYFKATESGVINEKREPEIILSLTSYPARMYDIHYTIYSLLTQTLKPNKIILYLGEDKFPNRDKDLPKNLLEFTKYGLEIRYTKDLKSFTKLIPALKEYPNSIIITADDDIFYPQNWLDKLYNCWKNNKDCVVCHRAHKVEIDNMKIAPYYKWKKCITENKSSFYNFFTGVGGVLYPPNCFYKDIDNEELFMKLAPNADDIWFWAMAVLNDTKRKQVNNYQMDILLINPARERNIINESCLWKINCVNSNNQNQIQLDNVINYYPQIMEKLLEEEKQNE